MGSASEIWLISGFIRLKSGFKPARRLTNPSLTTQLDWGLRRERHLVATVLEVLSEMQTPRLTEGNLNAATRHRAQAKRRQSGISHADAVGGPFTERQTPLEGTGRVLRI